MTHRKLKDRNSYLFTSESVADGHPDKICDQISDAILDACLEIDSNARVAVETVIKDHDVFLLGEVSDGARPGDIDGVVKGVLRDIGHTEARWGLDLERLNITKKISGQAREISSAVDKDDGELGAGDQGMMYGYACQETPELMPMPIALAHALMRRQREFRFEDAGHVLGPDAKAQVTVQYQNDEPVGIHTVVLSTQHAEDMTQSDLEELVREMIVNPVLADYGFDRPQTLYVNPSGSFCEGGPVADAGLTGRKIIVDTYGGYARHGGGAFSGKDATKVDRSGAYAARQLARSVVSSGLAGRCESRLAYAIGRPEPIELSLETWGSSDLSQEEILQDIMTPPQNSKSRPRKRRANKKKGPQCPVCGSTLTPASDCSRCLWKRHFSKKKTAEVKRKWIEMRLGRTKRGRRKLAQKALSPPRRDPSRDQRRRSLRYVFLKTQKSTRLQGDYCCDRCDRKTSVAWEYSRSNLGRVRLCSSCRVFVENKCFERIDALDRAYRGGAFGSKR